jgi:type I restriction enzyme S subunit
MKWPILKINRFCKTGSGGTPSTSKKDIYYGGDIPWVKSGELKDDVLLSTEETLTDIGLAESAAKWVPAGSVLIAMYGATIGKTALLGIDATTNQAVCNVIPNPQVADNRYVWYALRYNVPQFIAKRVGGAQPNISQKIISQSSLSVPPISEQHRIVEILGLADALRKKRAEADAKAAHILPALFYKMFGDPATNPKGWPIKRLGDPQVAIINPRFSGESVSANTELTFVPMADVDEIWGRIVGKQVRFYSEVMRGFTPFQDNDVLFAKITPCMQNGKAAIARTLANGHGFGSTEFHVLRAGAFAAPEWLYALVRLPWFKKQAEASFTGTAGQQRVPADFLVRYAIGCPPIGLQRNFAKALGGLQDWVNQTDRTRKSLEHLFTTLLHHAFTGDLTAKWRKAHMKELLQEMEQQAKALEAHVPVDGPVTIRTKRAKRRVKR